MYKNKGKLYSYEINTIALYDFTFDCYYYPHKHLLNKIFLLIENNQDGLNWFQSQVLLNFRSFFYLSFSSFVLSLGFYLFLKSLPRENSNTRSSFTFADFIVPLHLIVSLLICQKELDWSSFVKTMKECCYFHLS